jgi:hypothetical protein
MAAVDYAGMGREIANFHWRACTSCKHSPKEMGGCDVPYDEWVGSLVYTVDAMDCESFEPVEAEDAT